MNSLGHIEINVADLKQSGEFYSLMLIRLGWVESLRTTEVVGFKGPDKSHIFLVQCEEQFISNSYHRKNIGLNHIAFRVGSKAEVDAFCNFLIEKGITRLYANKPKDYSEEYGMNEYYAVFFEDPDRIKLEVVFVE